MQPNSTCNSPAYYYTTLLDELVLISEFLLAFWLETCTVWNSSPALSEQKTSFAMFRPSIRRYRAPPLSIKPCRRGHSRGVPPQRPSESTVCEVNSAVGTPSAAPEPVPLASFVSRLGPITSFVRWYGRVHGRRPLFTQFCTSVTIYAIGDVCAQSMGGKEHDPRRTGRALVIGAISSIPVYKWCG